MAPAQPYIDRIRNAPDLAALSSMFAEAGIPALIAAGVTVDPKDPNRYIVSVGFDGLGLPDRDFYRVDNERNRGIQAAYKDYLTFLLGKAGYADPQATAEQVYAFERQVADIEWARASLRDDSNVGATANRSNAKRCDKKCRCSGRCRVKGRLELSDFPQSRRPLLSRR